MTQLVKAKNKIITELMKQVAVKEGIEETILVDYIAQGKVVIPANINHKNLKPIGIGKDLRVKVNANIGNSKLRSSLKEELEKLKVAIEAGADTVMDLSTGEGIDEIRTAIIENSPIPVGTVPIYQTVIEAGSIEEINLSRFLKVFEKHAKGGVDFVTIHAGVSLRSIELVKTRVMECVSRGGAILLRWMKYHNKENFLLEGFEEILPIAKEYDVTLSLGDGLRPGCIKDATDAAQIDELKRLGELALKAKEYGIQVMIEGPGHIPLDQIEKNVMLEKEYCHDAPFYVLGPLPTDIATGYDHIASAIGGAIAAWKGADFLCYVTPKEHVGLPDINDVREGVVTAKIAAHIADIARGRKDSWNRDLMMAKARKEINWDKMVEFAIDPDKLRKLRMEECHKNSLLLSADYCSMCGEFCVFKVNK